MNISTPTGRMAEGPAPAGEPKDITHIFRAVDLAEALNHLERPDAARILAAMPISAAIQAFNVRDLLGGTELLELLPLDCAPAIVSGLHPDRRVDIFRQLSEAGRDRLKARLPEATREALAQLLQYPPQSAGGLMSTEFVAVPADWTVARTLRQILDVGRNRETLYTFACSSRAPVVTT